MNRTDVSNADDIIDSRTIIERLAEFDLAIDDGDVDEDAIAEIENYEGEYVALRDFADEGEQFGDWTYGVAFIRDSYFEDYAEQFADEIGAIDANAGWPLNCIDWKAAAEDLRQDYTSVEFDGVTYWGRV